MMNNYLQVAKGHFLYTSESVSSGRPENICDYISDCILYACLTDDKDLKDACERFVKNNM